MACGCAQLIVTEFLQQSSCLCSYDSVLLILSVKEILKNWRDGMLPVHGAFKPHGRSGKEPTEILQPKMKTKHLSIILDADQSDVCTAS